MAVRTLKDGGFSDLSLILSYIYCLWSFGIVRKAKVNCLF